MHYSGVKLLLKTRILYRYAVHVEDAFPHSWYNMGILLMFHLSSTSRK